MSPRLSRKEIKRDEFREGLDRVIDWLQLNFRLLLWIAGALLVAALLAYGWYAYRGHRESEANRYLAHAIAVSNAPVETKAPKPDDPVAPSFASLDLRNEKAKQLFEKLAHDFGSTRAGSVADVYLGKLAAAAGDPAQAAKLWQRFLDRHPDDMLAAEVQVNLFTLERSQGKSKEVEAKLQKMLDNQVKSLPTDVILYQLAVTQEKLGEHDKAMKNFRRIENEFSTSPYAAAAQRQTRPAARGAGAMISPQGS
ncbi:MAG TPA: tetratricopeptide repeat protein [Thermoanaerobaculia bacterium]|nr:tetratricopeptide repeat protein [Thermoanaerobaculia bacterium]